MIRKISTAICLLAAAFVAHGRSNPAMRSASSSRNEYSTVKQAPLAFVENKGQITDQYYNPRNDIQYKVAAGGGLNIYVGNGAVHYQFMKCENLEDLKNARPDQLPGKENVVRPIYKGYRMDVELIGANKNARVITQQKQSYFENYYTAGTGSNGVTVSAYGKVVYENIYPNIDWVLYSNEGHLKHEFIVKEGGKVSDIQIRYNGTIKLEKNAHGELIAATPQGEIKEDAPYVYQRDGKKIRSGFTLNGDVLSYDIDNYSGELIIDPTLAWATLYGGMGSDQAMGVATDNSGNVYMVGQTASVASIATVGAHQTTFGGMYYYGDDMLVKFDSTGNRLWATYYGGTNDELCYGVTVDASGNVYMAGGTGSTSGIATPGAYQSTFAGGTTTTPFDGFLVKFNGAGIRQWGTYYGGAGNEYFYHVSSGDSGALYLCGYTESTSGIASPGSFQPMMGGLPSVGGDGFFARFDTSGNRIWSSYYGGNQGDGMNRIVEHGGFLYLAGSSYSTGMATPGSYQPTLAFSYDGLLCKFTTGGARLWATYFGGNGNDGVVDLTFDNAGNIYFTGNTSSTTGIATAGAYQPTNSGGIYDIYLAKFDNAGSILWATYWGANDEDVVNSVVVDCSGSPYISGYTRSTSGFATAGAFYSTYGGGSYDCILSQFSSSGTLIWSTYYGGTGYDCWPLATIDRFGNLYYSGRIGTASIATPGAFQTTYGGGFNDAFLTKFRLGTAAPAPIVGASALCISSTTTLSTTAGGGTWSSTPPGIAGIGSATGIVYGGSAGTATITYTLPGGCNITTTITVDAPPNAGTISGPDSVCTGATITLTTSGSGGTWSCTPSGIAAVGSSGVVTGSSAGSAMVSYSVSNSCGSATATKPIWVLAAPAAGTISGASTVCVGASVTLSTTGSGGSWSSTPSSVASVGITGIVTGAASGIAVVSYVVTNSCGTDISTQSVTVTAPPTAGSISGPDSVCVGASIMLTATTTGGSWSTVGGAASVTGGVVSGLSPGTAVISYAVVNSCGADVATKTIYVKPLPVAGSITGADSVCASATITLSNTATGGAWSSSAGGIASVSSAGVVSGVSSGTAIISYLVSNSCGSASATKAIYVKPLPNAGMITGSTTVCPGKTITLSDAAPGGVWSSSGSIATVSTTGIVLGMSPGTVMISYTVTNSCGTSSATSMVTVLPFQQCQVGVPPSADQKTWQVFPNPSDGAFVIVWPETFEVKEISVINMVGEVVKGVEITPGQQQVSVNVPDVSAGNYLLQMKTNAGVERRKITIVK